MKVSKEQVRENRNRIVETASELFRERGYDGVGVAELMSAAGLTHGGFYKHFGSKADLLAEAMNCGFAQSAEKTQGVSREKFVEYYLSRQHRDDMAKGVSCRPWAPMQRASLNPSARPLRPELNDSLPF